MKPEFGVSHGALLTSHEKTSLPSGFTAASVHLALFMWVISVPIAFLLSRFTSLYAVWIFFLVQSADWIKCVIGIILIRRNVWMNNIVSNESERGG